MTTIKKYLSKALNEKSTGSIKSRSYVKAIKQISSMKKDLNELDKLVKNQEIAHAAEFAKSFIHSATFLDKTLNIFYQEIKTQDDDY